MVSLESVKYKGHYLGVKRDGSGADTHSFIPYLVSGKDQRAKAEKSECENVIKWEGGRGSGGGEVYVGGVKSRYI